MLGDRASLPRDVAQYEVIPARAWVPFELRFQPEVHAVLSECFPGLFIDFLDPGRGQVFKFYSNGPVGVIAEYGHRLALLRILLSSITPTQHKKKGLLLRPVEHAQHLYGLMKPEHHHGDRNLMMLIARSCAFLPFLVKPSHFLC